MTTKTLKHSLVEFFATARLAHACRIAAKRNKRLAQCATIHNLGHTISLPGRIGPPHELKIIVLSHAADDPFVLTGSEMEAVVSGAFHMLFTEPATHPDLVAQWMRRTNIRAENRLHIVRVENLEDQRMSELLGRVCYSLQGENARGNLVDAYLGGDVLYVRCPHHRMLQVPVASMATLRDQPRAVLQTFRIDADGSFLH